MVQLLLSGGEYPELKAYPSLRRGVGTGASYEATSGVDVGLSPFAEYAEQP